MPFSSISTLPKDLLYPCIYKVQTHLAAMRGLCSVAFPLLPLSHLFSLVSQCLLKLILISPLLHLVSRSLCLAPLDNLSGYLKPTYLSGFYCVPLRVRSGPQWSVPPLDSYNIDSLYHPFAFCLTGVVFTNKLPLSLYCKFLEGKDYSLHFFTFSVSFYTMPGTK